MDRKQNDYKIAIPRAAKFCYHTPMGNTENLQLMFDTLAYSEGLKSGGVEQSEVFAQYLQQALQQNIYTKAE